MHKVYFDTILLDVKETDAKQVYQKLSSHVASLIGTPEKFLLDAILHNEEHHNSGVENGVSIIHARLPRLTRPMIVFSKMAEEIDFKAADGEFVDMVALVLSPDLEEIQHLQRLATVTRFFGNKEVRRRLRCANDFHSIRDVVEEISDRKKAA